MAKRSQAGHIGLTGGEDVRYAGQMSFSKGKLKNWDNASGHYLPDADDGKNVIDALCSNGIDDISMDNFNPVK
jgi:hypothetical protein